MLGFPKTKTKLNKMVDSLVLSGAIKSERVRNAMKAVDRADFCSTQNCYLDQP